MRSWVDLLVRVDQQVICFCLGNSERSVRSENGVGMASPGCTSREEKSIVLASRRGGVPVLRRPRSRPRRMRESEMGYAAGSPIRPPLVLVSPVWSRPRMKVPVVRTIEGVRSVWEEPLLE